MFKLYNSSDSAVEVKTDVDTFLLMPKSVSLVEGSSLLKTFPEIQVLEQPSAGSSSLPKAFTEVQVSEQPSVENKKSK